MRRFVLLLLAASAARGAGLTETEVFRSGDSRYHTYRIPALVVSGKGTLLAFCEGRKNSAGDSGDIDLVLRRSVDGGRTWLPLQKILDAGEDTVGNPAPVAERSTGTIFLLLTRNPGQVSERQIERSAAQGDRTVWIMRSTDDGVSWAAPVEITSSVKQPEWGWYATGPGNGIQLRSGRLMVPCDHNRRDNQERHSHVIYSDDRGETWKIGGVAEDKTNESAVAEVGDGSLILNMRSYHGKNRRAVQRSVDGGSTWSALELDEALLEPVCQASLLAAAAAGKAPDQRLLFSNPASTKRENMTVRLSRDGGRTWPASRVIYKGPAAYSSLAMLRRNRVGLLYERGGKSSYESIMFARFGLKWINASR